LVGLMVSLKNDENGRGFAPKWAWLHNFCPRFACNCTLGTPLQEILDPPLINIMIACSFRMFYQCRGLVGIDYIYTIHPLK
ncbi:MAG: hypothetical protein MJE68_30230, partial [Proteobacteria bacterium]|nr:hypothetical protein [Pseudomonadota bacterium]